ncbi:hypothetical protein [Zooshikella sp. RANM57]|uniref:hypothetical protein n=1 Tax=Zooshikella sp. RANM57 TaxID=3425863 RepID=UPI003D6FB8E4
MTHQLPRFSANRPFKVVFYAINGTGLGHLARQLNIARALRSLLDDYGVIHQIEFLTTSDASQVANDFLTIKLPSKTRFKRQGLSVKRYNSRAKMLVSTYLSQLNPDWLIVDTAPQGAFNEIGFIKEYCKYLALIDRHKDEAIANSRTILKHKKLYSLIIAPEHQSEDPTVRCVGKIHGFNPHKALKKHEVRAYFRLQPEQQLVYISAGGGGDETADKSIDNLIKTLLSRPNLKLLVGYGPLYQGHIHYHERVIPCQESQISRFFYGIDFALSAAGYNSFEELLAAEVPTLFYAQPKGMDRQDLRATQGEANGWCLFWRHQPLDDMLDLLAQKHTQIKHNLTLRPSQQGAYLAALEILDYTAMMLPGEFVFANPLREQASTTLNREFT